MALIEDPRRALVRVAAAVLGVSLVWLTVLAFTRANPVDLTVALLVVLAEVLVVAVLSGPVLAVGTAFIAVALVNWYLVPPYGTLAIASTENVVALVVFVFVASVAASLVEIGARARSRAEVASRQAGLLGDVVTAVEGDDAHTALEQVRTGLALERVELRGPGDAEPDVVLASAGPATEAPVTVDVHLPDGYRLVGQGPELFAPDPEFLNSLGSAAVRAFETERLREESLRAAELEAIDRARTALLASVGHDLRTPLASLRVSIETIQSAESQLTPHDRAQLLDTIESSADRLDDLITNLLDMSRLQAGAVLAHPEPTDLAEVVARAVLASPSDRISVEIPPDLPAVSADPALLERIVANLLSNALRHSPVANSVGVVVRENLADVSLSVIDHGPGLSAADAERVFTAFHRVGAQPDGGTGLGLAIVKGFAEAMGMHVTLQPGEVDGLEARLVMSRWHPDGALR